MPTAVTERRENDESTSRKRRASPAEDSPKRNRKDDHRDKDSRDRGRDRDSGRRERDKDYKDNRDSRASKREDDSRRSGAEKSKSSGETKTIGGSGDRNGHGTSAAAKSQEALAADLKSKEMINEAKMKIQERIKELGLPMMHQPSTQQKPLQIPKLIPGIGPGGTSIKKDAPLRPEEASAFTQLHMEKMQRISEMKSRIAKGVQGLSLNTSSMMMDSNERNESPSMKWEPLELEQQIAATEVEEKKPPKVVPLQKVEPDSSTGPAQEFQDPRLHLKSANRQRRRQFQFKQPGEYEKLAKIQRSKAKLERLQSEIEKAAKQTGISSAVKLAIVTPSGLPDTSTGEYIPEVEWWDEVVIGNGKGYDDIPSLDLPPVERYADAITDLVEHPIQLKPPDEPLQPQYLKASLTKKERKKMRRQNRRETIKEKAEKIRLGLEKPPEPKLKISNLMRVLGTDAIQDPTKMEAVVRKQMAERAQKHVEDNTSRKLTREEKSAKAIRKVAEDTSLAVHVTVWKVKSFANPAKKFKVMMNAKQLQMTGIIILMEDINVVVMEGGPKQQKFFTNLMQNRIKWAEEIAGQRHVRKQQNAVEDGGDEGGQQQQGERNECTLIWEGIVQKRAFNGEPRFLPATNHKHARELLDKHFVAHYWDLCYSTTILLSDDK